MSCHPLPTVSVTAIGAGLAALAGLPLGRGSLVTAAIFTGQLSIGWSNDYLDAARDRTSHRFDKPVATGALTPRVAGIAAISALALTVALSVVLGWPGGAAALVIVACGWGYNLGLKATPWSWLPYALAFGMLPAVATLSALPPRWPAWWSLAAGALLGVVAHLANVLPDLTDDVAAGVRGLPHRIGARATALTAAALLLTASAVILLGPADEPGPWNWVAFAASVLVSINAARLAFGDPTSRKFFVAIILVVLLDVSSFALAGASL